MTVTLEVSQVIDRPVAEVFQFHARDHVANHPRWDPQIQLEFRSEGPMGVGAVIDRVNTRSGAPVEGTMEVVEYEPDQAIAMVIHDGPVEMVARATYEETGLGQTNMSWYLELPGMDEGTDTSSTEEAIRQSLQKIKRLLEEEG